MPARTRRRVPAAKVVLATWPCLLAAGCLAAERAEQEADAAALRAILGRGEPGDPGAPDLEVALGREVSVEQAVEAALRRNPDVLAALERWVAWLERVPQETAPPDPSLRYAYSSMDRAHAFGVEQEVPFPGKLLAAGQAALQEASAVRADARTARAALRQQVVAACTSLYLARRELDILDQNLAVLERLVEVARVRYETGGATQPDLLRAEVEREGLRAERATLAGGLRAAEVGLNVLLVRPPGAALGSIAALGSPSRAAETEEGLVALALERRPELAAARARIRAALHRRERAELDWVPDLVLGASYVRDFGMDEDEVEAMAGFRLPLFWWRVSSGVAEAEAEVRRMQAEEESARIRAVGEVSAAWAQVQAAAERHRVLVQEVLPRARQSLEASQAAYTSSKIGFLDLLDAQRMLLARELDAERALAEHALRRAELERSIGEGGGWEE